MGYECGPFNSEKDANACLARIGNSSKYRVTRCCDGCWYIIRRTEQEIHSKYRDEFDDEYDD